MSGSASALNATFSSRISDLELENARSSTFGEIMPKRPGSWKWIYILVKGMLKRWSSGISSCRRELSLLNIKRNERVKE